MRRATSRSVGARRGRRRPSSADAGRSSSMTGSSLVAAAASSETTTPWTSTSRPPIADLPDEDGHALLDLDDEPIGQRDTHGGRVGPIGVDGRQRQQVGRQAAPCRARRGSAGRRPSRPMAASTVGLAGEVGAAHDDAVVAQAEGRRRGHAVERRRRPRRARCPATTRPATGPADARRMSGVGRRAPRPMVVRRVPPPRHPGCRASRAGRRARGARLGRTGGPLDARARRCARRCRAKSIAALRGTGSGRG